MERGAKLVLMSNLGDPEGKVVPELRLDPVADRLRDLLRRPVEKLTDCVGEAVSKAVGKGKPGDVFLLENVRFHPGESANDADFAHARAFTVVGGGETGEAVVQMGEEHGISYISTGGGACLALLRGKSLPALEALRG
jgi:3-phosphoglycerate kinase